MTAVTVIITLIAMSIGELTTNLLTYGNPTNDDGRFGSNRTDPLTFVDRDYCTD